MQSAVIICCTLLFCVPFSFAQQAQELPPEQPGPELSENTPETVPEYEELPNGFREILLGMDLEAVKEVLSDDPDFDFRGDPDVSLLPQPQDTMIECAGFGYIRHAWFQFNEQRLYTIIIDLNPERMDFHTIYTTLLENYGEFDSMNPDRMQWENDEVILLLERPVTIKYIDKAVFESLNGPFNAPEDLREVNRQEFLQAL